MKHENPSSYFGCDLTEIFLQTTEVTSILPPTLDDDSKSPPACESAPAVILPLYPEETPVGVTPATVLRRGAGWSEPMECQVPVDGDVERGAGRCPLTVAWDLLRNHRLDSDALSKPPAVSWTPVSASVEVQANVAIMETVSQLSAEQAAASAAAALVIPEDFMELEQELLLRAWKPERCLHLVPQSVAYMLYGFAGGLADMVKDLDIGSSVYVPWIHLGLDGWRVEVVGAEVTRHESKFFLVPKRSWSPAATLCNPGLSLAFAMARYFLPSDQTPQDFWRAVFVQGRIKKWFADVCREPASFEPFWNWVTSLAAKQEMAEVFSRLPVYLRGLHTTIDSPLHYVGAICKAVAQQKQQINDSKAIILDPFVTGSFRNLPDNKGRLMYQAIGDQLAESSQRPYHVRSFDSGDWGAAQVAFRIANGLPSYKQALRPMDLYCEGKDEWGDTVAVWYSLISDEAVPAGKPLENTFADTGLAIPAGSNQLRLILRSPNSVSDNTVVYRSVLASWPEPAEHNEAVCLHVTANPSHGFAVIEIRSKDTGKLISRLDWSTMAVIDKLPPISRPYILKCCEVRQRREEWHNAVPRIKTLIEQWFDKPGDDPCDYWGPANSLLGYKPSCVVCRKSPDLDDDPFVSYGPIGRYQDFLPGMSDKPLKDLSNALAMVWQSNEAVGIRDKLLSRASYLLGYIPTDIRNYVIGRLKRDLDGVSRGCLAVIGRCFNTDKEISLFYKALTARLSGDIKGELNWLRAFRDIVKHNQNALSPACMTTGQVAVILKYLLRVMNHLVDHQPWSNRNQRLRPVVWALLFLLKRRRYDRSFLVADAEDTNEVNQLLDRLLQRAKRERMKEDFLELCRLTIKFLNHKANDEDEAQVLMLLSDENNNDDGE